MAGEVADVRLGMGMMKSSVRPFSPVGCMITEVCSKTVSAMVLDTLNLKKKTRSVVHRLIPSSEILYLEDNMFLEDMLHARDNVLRLAFCKGKGLCAAVEYRSV